LDNSIDESIIQSPSLSPIRLLPTIAARVFIKKNKKSLATPKNAKLDPNKDYVIFKHDLVELVCKKLDILFDPFEQPNIKFLCAWRTVASVNSTTKKPLSPSEYSDLDDEGDYEAIQQLIESSEVSSKNGAAKMILLISAAITIDNEGPSNTFEEDLHPHSTTDPQAIGGSPKRRVRHSIARMFANLS
jgi:hypothetical protein